MSDFVFWLIFIIGSILVLLLSLYLRNKKIGYIFIPPVTLGVIASITYMMEFQFISFPIDEEPPVIMVFPLLFFVIAGTTLVIAWIIFYTDVRKTYKI